MSDFFDSLGDSIEKKKLQKQQRYEQERKPFCKEFISVIDKKISDMYKNNTTRDTIGLYIPKSIDLGGFEFGTISCRTEFVDFFTKKYNAKSVTCDAKSVTCDNNNTKYSPIEIIIDTKHKSIHIEGPEFF